MTEQDERTIYEWVYEELRGLPWVKVRMRASSVGWCAYYSSTGRPPTARLYKWTDSLIQILLPALGHNFAFDVCVPKLVSEGVKVSYRDGVWWFDAPEKDAIYASPDFYKNLVTYMKGAK